ncbi:MAG: response regulator [Archangium sp.]|nr:response regulator [Archangium sp.]
MRPKQTPAWFSTQEAEGLADFWAVYDEHYDALNASALKAVALEPSFAALLATMTPEQLATEQRLGRERVRRVMAGDWQDYEAHLRLQGTVYARLGITFSSWYRLVRIAARDLTPLVVTAFASEPARLSAALLGMQAWFDWAMAMLGEVYLAAKEAVVRASEQDLATTLDSIGDGVISTDLEGAVRRMNPVAERLTGWSLADAKGRPLEQVFRIVNERTREVVESPAARVLREGLIIGLANHTALVARDGTERPIADSGAPIRDEHGAMRGVVLVFRDQSQQYALEAENRKIQEANRLKSEFLANMSHELRTPLNAIIGFAELLHDGQVRPDMPQHQEFLGDILASGRHLQQLINDVLDLAKVEAGKLEFHPEAVDLRQVVSEVVAILRTTAAEKRITVSVDIDPTLTGLTLDGSRLKQVLYNYVSNALKFTGEAGAVTVSARPEPAGRFRLEVRDTGIGVAAGELDRLFTEFQQLDAGVAKRHAGTGLGLALTRRLAEAQGGSVGVTSTPGVGSTFFVVLPRVALGGSPLAAPRRLAGVPGAPSILVVEDNVRDQALIVKALTTAGYAVETAASGAQAVARCAERAFDAITLDLLLPDTNGLEVLRAIRAGALNRDVPVIVITVVTERGAAAGFAVHDILAKPLEHGSMLASLARAGLRAGRGGPVLVVDDDVASSRLMAATLAQLGFESTVVQRGAAGLERCAGEPPLAVVLDLLMPEMNGFEFLERFRQLPGCKAVPVIVWTVKDLTADDRRRLETSVQAVLQKGHAGIAVVDALRAFLPATGEC